MENIVELSQDEISNIARKAFIRGSIDALHNLNSYFSTFKSKVINREELQEAIKKSIEKLQVHV